jgi:hypothetical protein
MGKLPFGNGNHFTDRYSWHGKASRTLRFSLPVVVTRTRSVSRAFVNEDAGSGEPVKGFGLPSRDDPGFDAVAAEVLLEAARNGDTSSAERATGYYWGEPRLKEHVRRILERARKTGDDRLEQLAERFLR